MSPRHRLLPAAAAIVAIVAAAPASAAALPSVLTQDAKHPWTVKPASIDFTGDSTGVIGGTDGTSPFKHPGHLRWKTYNKREGTATGRVWLNTCEPTCADGKFHAYRATIHVSSPKSGHFLRLTLKYTYNSRHVTDRRRAARHGSYWAYEIVGR